MRGLIDYFFQKLQAWSDEFIEKLRLLIESIEVQNTTNVTAPKNADATPK